MAIKKTESYDPTITSTSGPETVGPAPTISDADHSADSLAGTYKDMPDSEKPDPTTVAQVQEVPVDWPGR